MIKTFFFRYFSYAFIALDILLLPILFSKTEYGEFEFIRAIIGLSPYILLGSFSGYLYYKYSEGSDFYNELLMGGMIIAGSISLIYSLYRQNFTYFSPLICFPLSVIIEKRFQVLRQFTLSFIFKPLLSIIIVILAFSKIFSLNIIIIFSYPIALILWIIIGYFFVGNEIFPSKLFSYRLFSTYKTLINKGFLINVSTILLAIFSFYDRYIVSKYFSYLLPSFSLAYNFAQIIYVGIGTISLIYTIQIGENIRNLDKAAIIELQKKSILIYFVLNIFVFISYAL